MSLLLTIIVPAYNVEKYIADCLNSLVHQTLMNHKIIIVNDGSSDQTEEICLKYQREYADIISYIYQENQGLGAARNTGMQNVDTPFLCFLDSDDWLNTKYVEEFSKLIEDTDELPDLVFTLPWVYDSVTKRVNPWKDKPLYDRVFEVNNGRSSVQINTRQKPELYALEVNACRKIYRTALLRDKNFSFPENLKWEDVPGHFELLHEANVCMALPEIGFFYRINHGGQITAGNGVSRLDMLPIFQKLLDVQEQFNFNQEERGYVLRVIIDFSMWSVDATNLQYIDKLLYGLHSLYQKFTENDISYYLSHISPLAERERGFISCLRGENYLKLKDYDQREATIVSCSVSECPDSENNADKKRLFQGGIRCICEHGISYTVIWMFRKYVLGQK